MKSCLTSFLLIGSLLAFCPSSSADVTARGVGHYHDERTGLTVVAAEIDPSFYEFEVVQPGRDAPIAQLIVTAAFDEEEDANDLLNDRPKPNTLWLIALLRDKEAAAATLTLRAWDDESKTKSLHWPLQDSLNATADSPEQAKKFFTDWLRIRNAHWKNLTTTGQPNLLVDLWARHMTQIYDVHELYPWRKDLPELEDANDDLTDMGSLAVFGGQAAIAETLQTQLLTTGQTPADSSEETVEIANIQAVEVQSHPYAEMLAQLDAPVAVRTLADYVPADRFLVLLQDPKQLAKLLGGSDDTAQRLTPLLGQQFTDYDLLERYAARFGLTAEQAQLFFTNDSIIEVALFSPDIFFRDNTELTFILRLKEPTEAKGSLLNSLTASGEGNKPFFVTQKSDLLFASTSKQELEQAVALADNNGTGSLGHSDEFQVMLNKLPITADTRLFVYFSDPFIRRLTGPEVKIGQYRRAIARRQMEYLTALCLLYRIDHGVDAPDLQTLRQRGYLAADAFTGDAFTLGEGSVVTSSEWGPLGALKSLSENPARLATQSEAQGYDAYRDRYTQFWQKHFDPIAVRLDWLPDGSIAVETFILPLIENSLYNQLKATLGTETPETIRIPRYSEPMVATFAFKIPDKKDFDWVENLFHASTGYQIAQVLPKLGNTVTFSIRDSAPILQFPLPGVTTLNQRNALTGMQNSELIYLPIIGALFTRDCDLAIAVKDEDAIRHILRNFTSRGENWVEFNAVYLEADNTLLLDFTLVQFINLQLAITLEDGWLHISNHPWTPTPIIGTDTLSPSHANIILKPSALKKGLPQAIARAHSAYRNSIYTTAANLLPWMVAYADDIPSALNHQKAALGHSTPLPPEVQLDVGQLNTIPYGTSTFQQASDSALTDTGLLQNIQDISLWLRFEDDGLRTHVQFRNAAPAPATPPKPNGHSPD